MKFHLKHVVASTKFTFEEFTTILSQVEACLNSRPPTPSSCDSDSVKALTPGYFLIGKPIESLRALPLLRRWHLCQSIVRHFWQRWSAEYVTSLRRLTKWQHPTRNFQVGDIVVLQEDNLVPTKWPLALMVKVHVGNDKLVRVVTVKTSTGTISDPRTRWLYCYPIHKTKYVNIIGYFVFITFMLTLRPSGLGRGMLCPAVSFGLFRSLFQYFIAHKFRVG